MTATAIDVQVRALLVHGHRVLLGQNAADAEEQPWQLPGGPLQFGESFIRAVQRQVQEQAGIELSPRTMQMLTVLNNVAGEQHIITIGYLGTDITDTPAPSETVARWSWYPLHDVPDTVTPQAQELIEKYQQLLQQMGMQ